jgi:PKD repeat protein
LGRNDTWSFQTGLWTNRTSTGLHPAIRFGASLADDPVDGYVVLFGGGYGCDGWCSNWVFYNDTWAYRSGTWQLLNATSPPSSRSDAILTLDPTTNEILLSGGSQYGGGPFVDTWLYRAGDWTLLNVTPPGVARDTTMYATDWSDRAVTVFGGWGYGWPGFRDTWYFQGEPFHAAATATPETGASPLAVSFDSVISGGTPPLNVTWSFGDGTNGSGLLVIHRYASAGIDWVHLNVTDALGNWTDAYVEVGVQSNLTARAFADVTVGVSPLSVAFTGDAVGGAPPYSFSWTFGDDSSSSLGPNASHAYFAPGEFRAVLTVRDGLSSTGTSAVEISAVPVPLVVSLSSSALVGDAPLSVQFNGSESGGYLPYSFLWEFGDGSEATSPSPSHQYLSAGSFTVSLLVSDGRGQLGQRTAVVQVFSTPAVTASVGPIFGTAPLAIRLTGTVLGGAAPYSVLWSFGDGSYGVQLNMSHLFFVAGQYVLSVAVTDRFGTTALDGPWTVEVAASPVAMTATLDVAPVSAMYGTEVNLSAIPEGGMAPFIFAWSGLPPNCAGSDAARLACVPLEVGTFGPQVIVTDASGDRAIAIGALVVLAPTLRIALTVNPADATIGGGVWVNWTISGGVPPLRPGWDLPTWCTVEGPSTAVCEPDRAGAYSVGVVVVDSADQAAWANATIVVEPAPVPAGQVPSLWGVSPTETLGLGIGIGAVAGAILVLFAVRRDRRTP